MDQTTEKKTSFFLMAKLVSQERRGKKINVDCFYQIKDYAVYSFSRVFYFHGRRRRLFGTRRPWKSRIDIEPAHTKFFTVLSYARWRSIIIRGYATFQTFFPSHKRKNRNFFFLFLLGECIILLSNDPTNSIKYWGPNQGDRRDQNLVSNKGGEEEKNELE